MYENENDVTRRNNEQTTGSAAGSYGNSTYSNGQNSYGGYSSQNTSTGSYSGSNTYSGAGQQSSSSYSGGTGTYQGQSTGNYSSYNQANYNSGNTGNYSNPGSTNYGSYQYGNYGQMPSGNGNGNGPKKGGAGKVVAIAVAAVAVVALLSGGVYYSFSRISNSNGLVASNKDEEKGIEQQDNNNNQTEDAAPAEDSTQEEESNTTENSSSSEGISQTQTVDEDAAVVTDVTEVVSAAMPAMVSINNNYTESYNYFGQSYSQDQTASGSGIIVGTNDTELLIATNYHVIEGADSLEVQFVDSNTAKAEVKGTDSNMDLAVIAVQLSDLSDDTKGAIAVATLGDSDSLVLGEPAIAIGNALGYGQSVTTGVISAVDRVIDLSDTKTGTFIQTSAAINPGNSGGALLNISGEVIGINSNKIGGEAIEGMGYAIPISTAKPIIEKLMTEKTRSKVSDDERGYLGISGVSVTSEVSEMYGLPLGVYVAAVSSNGGAQAAGIQEGDIITKFDGNEISSMDDLQNRLAYYSIGETVSITVMRQSDDGYQEQDVEITLGEKASTQDAQPDESYNGDAQEDAKPEEGDDSQQQGQQDPFGNGNGNNGGFGFGFDFGN